MSAPYQAQAGWLWVRPRHFASIWGQHKLLADPGHAGHTSCLALGRGNHPLPLRTCSQGCSASTSKLKRRSGWYLQRGIRSSGWGVGAWPMHSVGLRKSPKCTNVAASPAL